MSTEHKKGTTMTTPTQNTPLHPLLDLAEFTDRAIIRTIPFPVGTPHHQHLLETNSCRLYYTEHGILTFHAITPSILEEHKGGCYSERLIIATACKGFTTYLAYDPLWTATEEKNTDAPEDNYTRAALWLKKTTYEPGHAARYRIEHILRSAYHLTPEQTSSLLTNWDSRFTPNIPYQSSTSANPIGQTSTQTPNHSSEKSVQALPSLPHTQRKQ